MKMNKFFMLGLAGLAFAACNNEDEVGGTQVPEGNGAVTVKIVSPAMTRSVETGTTESSVTVTGTVEITLTASNGSKTITLTKDQLASQNSVTFWNVETPEKVTVTMNGGKASYENDEPTLFGDEENLIAPENIPVYGEVDANGIKLTSETTSPGKQGGSDYEASVNNETANSSTVYQLYTATVQLAIPVARLEVSGIQHITASGSHTADDCAYQTLTIAGVYLDNVYSKGYGVTYKEGAFPCVSDPGENEPTDYSYDGEHGTGIEAIWKDAVTTTDFLTVDAVWPETTDKAYSYYFFGADNGENGNNLPKFKIYFDSSKAKDEASPLPAPRYAMINSYKTSDGTPITKFEPGHIYRITSAQLTDENIIGDEGGNTLYGVEVTVEEATWTVKTIEADWAN